MTKRFRIATLVAPLLLVVGTAGGAAQTDTPAAAEATGEVQFAQDMLAYSYDRMRRFAVAYLLVAEVQQDYDPKLKRLKVGSDKYNKLVAESDARMVEAIESAGLSPADYNALADAVASNEELEKQVIKLVKQLGREASRPQQALASTAESEPVQSDPDVVDLGTMEVEGFRITKSLIDAEVEVALRRPISMDREDDYLLICRDSTTGTNIKRRWCAYNVDLTRAKRTDGILYVDPRELQFYWERFYDRLPD